MARQPQMPQVIGVEMFPPMAALAQKIVDLNSSKWMGKIDVVAAHSSTITVRGEGEQCDDDDDGDQAQGEAGADRDESDSKSSVEGPLLLERRADMLVSELLDSTFLGEVHTHPFFFKREF